MKEGLLNALGFGAMGLVASYIVCTALLFFGFVTFGLLMLPLIVVFPTAALVTGYKVYKTRRNGEEFKWQLFWIGVLLPLLYYTLDVLFIMKDFLIEGFI